MEPVNTVNTVDTIDTIDTIDNPAYWIQHLKDEYFITSIPEGRNPQEVASLAKRILNWMFERELYPTSRVLQFAITHLPEELISAAVENKTPQQLMSIYDFHEGITYDLKKEFPRVPGVTEHITFPEGGTLSSTTRFTDHLQMHLVLNSFEKQYWKTILNFVMNPTIYLTPQGPVVVTFDKDRYEYLEFENIGYNDKLEIFQDYISDNMTCYERMLFVQYF